MFKVISEAYQVLSDKEKKKRYDFGLEMDLKDIDIQRGGADPFDTFNLFFTNNSFDQEDIAEFNKSGRFPSFPFQNNFGWHNQPRGFGNNFKYGFH